MSDDFLSSLAAQALGTASVVRPRVASRFEPRPAGGDLHRGWPEPAEIDAGCTDLADSPREGCPAAGSRHDQPAGRAGDDLGHRGREAGAHRRYPAPKSYCCSCGTRNARVASRSPSAPARREPAQGPLGEVAPARGERASSLEGAGVTAPPERGREPAPVPPVPAHAAAETPQNLPTVTREAAQSSRTGDPVRQGAVRPPTVMPEVRPARQDAVPVQTRRAAREIPPPQAPADSGPTIQVTIGRVEVRATTSPAAGPARPPASPVMTLEEYLRRKTERGNS